MAKYKNPLKDVKVASPCSADWENMIGDERRRFCGQCELNVYNLSEMSRREAEDLINRTEGRLCVRFYRRADGTVLTKDCPVGLRAVRRKVKRVATAALSTVLGFFSGIGFQWATREQPESVIMGDMVTTEETGRFRAEDMIMGAVAVPPAGFETGEMAIDPPLQGEITPARKGKKRNRR